MGSPIPSTSNSNLCPYNNAVQQLEAKVLEASSTHAISYVDGAIGYSGSHSNPSLTPHSTPNEPDTVDFVSSNRKQWLQPTGGTGRTSLNNACQLLFGHNSSVRPEYVYQHSGPGHNLIWTSIVYS